MKGYGKKKKERLARKRANEAMSALPSGRYPGSSKDTVEPCMVSLPLISYTCGQAKTLNELQSRLMKVGGLCNWQVVEANVNRLALAKMKLDPSPHVVASVQIHSNFEYNVAVEEHVVRMAELGTTVGSRVSCVSDVLLLLRAIDLLHMCEGNLCSEFLEVVQHNRGKFLGTDCKF